MGSKQLDTIYKSESTGFPGMWRFGTNPEHCCIYRVPNCIRQVNPEAYTPQLVIIGPLHHSLKSQALKSLGDITDAKSMGYLNMEAHKNIYLAEFGKRVGGERTIDGFRRMIKQDEDKIRESYSESTAWIKSPEFVEMILHDSVFIVELMLRHFDKEKKKLRDPLIDMHCLLLAVHGDLVLLENQLPYFILEKLFDPIIPRLFENRTFKSDVICFFRLKDKNINNSTFKHFTDLFRFVHVETLPRQVETLPRKVEPLQESALEKREYIQHMYNAYKLESVGVKFEAVEVDFSLYVRFENGCLKMPYLKVEDCFEMTLRNIMAFEQCHDLENAHVCAYIIFLDHLIDTEKDVDLLVEKGIIKNNIGQHSLVAEMVNKLCTGIVGVGSYYPNIALEINAYYSNPFNKSRAVLKRVYFTNLWTGTGTVAAMCLLLMTLIQTISSIIQVKQNASAP